VKPILQALLVADHVYTDQATGKKVVAGIFHRLWFAIKKAQVEESSDGTKQQIQIPTGGLVAGSPFCYISLTELRGKQDFTLRYILLDEDKPIFEAQITLDGVASPLETVEVVLPLPQLPAEKPGTYALSLLWNDEELGAHRISVSELPEGEGSGNE
jgi:hypothetical protein